MASDSKDANFSSKPSVLFKMPALSNLLSKKVNKQLDFFKGVTERCSRSHQKVTANFYNLMKRIGVVSFHCLTVVTIMRKKPF